MTNWHVEDRLNAYLANEVEPEEKDFIESHLEICANCRQELEFLQELEMLLDDLPLEDPGPVFTDSVMARVKEETPVSVTTVTDIRAKSRRSGFWRGSDFRNMAASVVAAFVLFQGFAGIVPKVPEVDSTISAFAVLAKVKVEIWVQSVTRSID